MKLQTLKTKQLSAVMTGSVLVFLGVCPNKSLQKSNGDCDRQNLKVLQIFFFCSCQWSTINGINIFQPVLQAIPKFVLSQKLDDLRCDCECAVPIHGILISIFCYSWTYFHRTVVHSCSRGLKRTEVGSWQFG